ncbi:hypothetical protein [Citrobacter freundii]|uniref:hypothetical protein n=1 Tax=Citrobacter freundii TaxID=546 RepID=UPI0011C045F2|nr:hypothetical protein [Citrobacter freundii]
MSRGFEFDALRLHLPRRQQAAYKKAVNDYLSAINRYGKQCSQTGAVNLSPDIPSAIVAIEKILTYAKHR